MEYLFVFLAYCVGSIPFGLVLGKVAGLDVRRAGSGNIGATNVSRLLGKKLGALTLLADAGKGALPMLLAAWLLRDNPSRDMWVMLCGAAAFVGHLYPVYLKFKGGKGVATALGIFLYLDPLAVLIGLAVFALVVAVWGYVSLGSLSAAVVMPGFVFLLGGSPGHVLLAVFVGSLIWLKHRDNIGRLLRHEEKSWKKGNEAAA